MKTKLLILFILIMVGLLLASLFFLSREAPTRPSEKITKQASLSLLVPGQTKRGDILKKTGVPSSIETKGGRTYFYYDTQNSSFKDLVVLENDIELYALENIFSSEEISLENTVRSFGEYEVYYSRTGPFLWYTFLNRGIALETDEKDILRILYFIPIEEEGFLKFFEDELDLSKEPPTPETLRP